MSQVPSDQPPPAGVHPTAIVGESVELGKNVSIAAGAVVLGRCRIGENCVIGPGAVLDAGASPASLVLEPDSQVLASVTVPGAITIGRGAKIRPGTVVTRDVPPHAIVAGNPAQIVGYTVVKAEAGSPAPSGSASGEAGTRVAGVTVHSLPKILDLRGNLTVGEFGRSLPFEPKRYFMVFGVPNAEIRGEHAHRTCKQFLICAHGSCRVVADDGQMREEFLLDDPSRGLYLPPLTWGVQYKYSADAVLLVFASEFYDSDEYIRDYSEFRELAASRTR